MANWFKLYETDLDETRMRFALTKLPEVWPVWTAILMECCKHRDANIRWGASDQELFGFADRLKISIPKVNEAINILCSIEYVKKSNGHLNVLKWNEKQDDYLARKSRGYWDKRKKSQCFTVKHEKKSVSHIEERRGEEKREEKSTPSERSRVSTYDHLKSALEGLFKRTGHWSSYEEQALHNISKRPEAISEMAEVVLWRQSLPPKEARFFPQSVTSTVGQWEKWVDTAKTQKALKAAVATEEDVTW